MTESLSSFHFELCRGYFFDLEKASPMVGCLGLVLLASTDADVAEELVDAPVDEERSFAICA